MCMTAMLDVTPKTTEQNRIVRTGKSEAEVTNNNKNCARGIVLLKLTTDRHEARAASLRQQSYLYYSDRKSVCLKDLTFMFISHHKLWYDAVTPPTAKR